jgi:hypothetical protein
MGVKMQRGQCDDREINSCSTDSVKKCLCEIQVCELELALKLLVAGTVVENEASIKPEDISIAPTQGMIRKFFNFAIRGLMKIPKAQLRP